MQAFSNRHPDATLLTNPERSPGLYELGGDLVVAGEMREGTGKNVRTISLAALAVTGFSYNSACVSTEPSSVREFATPYSPTFDTDAVTNAIIEHEQYIKAAIWKNTQDMNHSDFEDIYQETCLRIALHLHKFRHDSRLSTWIYRVASNTAHSWADRRKRHQFNTEITDDITPTTSDVHKLLIDDPLLFAIDSLHNSRRNVLLLSATGLPHSEIELLLGITESAVKLRLLRARSDIKKHLGTNSPEILLENSDRRFPQSSPTQSIAS